jgi:hypothetical protein
LGDAAFGLLAAPEAARSMVAASFGRASPGASPIWKVCAKGQHHLNLQALLFRGLSGMPKAPFWCLQYSKTRSLTQALFWDRKNMSDDRSDTLLEKHLKTTDRLKERSAGCAWLGNPAAYPTGVLVDFSHSVGVGGRSSIRESVGASKAWRSRLLTGRPRATQSRQVLLKL